MEPPSYVKCAGNSKNGTLLELSVGIFSFVSFFGIVVHYMNDFVATSIFTGGNFTKIIIN